MAVNRNDVARRARVSAAVVSYVVNEGPKRVSEERRQRVLRAIEELGYRPNAMARALKIRASDLIGLIIPEHGNPFLDELVRSISRRAATIGKGVILATPVDSAESMRITIEGLLARRVDALFIVSREWPDELRASDLDGVPVAVLDAAHELSEGPSIGVDDSAGADMAVAHLVQHGRRTVGCIYSPTLLEREMAWREAALSRGLPVDGLSFSAPVSRQGGYEASRAMFSAPITRPDALYISTDIQAIGALRALSELGIRVPEDVAIVSFDDSEPAAYSVPALTSVSQRLDEIADSAFRVTFGDGQERNVVLSPSLVIRESCGC